MSKESIFKEEIARRRQAMNNLKTGIVDLNATLEQINDLDETYKEEQQRIKNELECVYLETRHYTSSWPIVYEFSQTDKYPYFNGDTDDVCNPYFRISTVLAGTDDGIAPQFSGPTRTGSTLVNRTRGYAFNEPSLRSTALSALKAYPDISQEDTSDGTCSDPTYTTQETCELNGGTWSCTYDPAAKTAPELLEDALIPWRDEVTPLKADICQDELDAVGADALLQSVLDKITTILTELPPRPTCPDHTPPPTGTLETAINTLISLIEVDMVNDIDTRETGLAEIATALEDEFFGIIGLRLHQINGSHSKVRRIKDQVKTSKNLIEDHTKAIASINVLRVQES